MVSLLCIVFLLGFYAYKRKFDIGQFDPINLYLLVQFGALAIAYLKLNSAMTDWLPITWVVFLGSSGFFLAGSFLARRSELAIGVQNRVPEKLIGLILSFFVLWAIVGFAFGVQRAGIPILSNDQDQARKAFGSIRFSIAFGLQNALLIYALSAALFFANSRFLRWLGIFGFAFGVFSMLAVGTRNPVLFALFVIGYCWSVQVHPIRKRIIVASLALFVTVFLAVALMRLGMGLDYSWVFHLPKSELIRFGKGFVTPIYEYIANNYWNLDYNLGRIQDGVGHSHTFGFSMMDGIFSLPGIAKKMQDAVGWDSIMNETARKVYYLNTVCYQWTLYKDFGILGVFIGAGIWGWIATWLHRQAEAMKNPVFTALSGVFQFSVFFSFFAWYFVIPSYLIAIAVIAMLACVSTKSKQMSRSNAG